MADPLTQDNVLDESSRKMLGQSEAAKAKFDERRGFFKKDYFLKPGYTGYDFEDKRPPLRPFSKLDAFRETRKFYESPYNLQRDPDFDKMYEHEAGQNDRLNAFFYPGYKQGIRRDPSLMYGPGWDPNDPHRYTQYGFNPWGSQVEGFPRPMNDWEGSLRARRKGGEISFEEMLKEMSRLDHLGPRNPDSTKASRAVYENSKRDQEGFDQMSILEAIRILNNAGVIKLSEGATEPSEKAAAKALEELEKEQESGEPIKYHPSNVIPPKVKKKVSDMEKENQRRRQEAIN